MAAAARRTVVHLLFALGLGFGLVAGLQQLSGHDSRHLARAQSRNRLAKEPVILKDTYHEDNSFVVRIRTNFGLNSTTSAATTPAITCNAVMMTEELVLSDVTCIKYQQMANIDAKFVRVIAGESGNETEYEVDQIYVNKANPRDPGTELALLRLSRKLGAVSQCKTLMIPEYNQSIVSDTPVRVVGFTSAGQELKESRSRVTRRNPVGDGNYVYTSAVDKQDNKLGIPTSTPGSLLLRGAPLLQMVDCKHYQLIGVLAKTETLIEGNSRKEQDVYVKVASIMRWFGQVKDIGSLKAKTGPAPSAAEPSVVVVTVDTPETTTAAN